MWDEASAAAAGAGKDEERILVSVRLRPLNVREAESGDSCDWECINPTTIVFKAPVPDRSMLPTAYSFDKVFGSQSTTRQVYEEGAKEVALSVLSGINSSVFAYGQTSSGKTYTMTGVTEYSVNDIYDHIKKHTEREFLLKFSAMEIYNEAVRDLLSSDMTPLRLLDDPERGTVVERLIEETLRDQGHLKELLSMCEAQRQIGETSLNEMSSRSHQILRLTIESSPRNFLGRDASSTLIACVNFVDLAGSERASQAASAGTRLKEGSHINRSLLTLGKVIRQLSKGKNGHVPYRDSKLTRILQSSLGGNARTAIICTMSPAHSHVEQSRNTLLFATCAKEVVTNAKVNLVMSDKALVKHLQRELARLENELKYPGSAPIMSHDEVLKEKDAHIKKLENELKEIARQRDIVQSRLDELIKSAGDYHADDHSDEHTGPFFHVRNSSVGTTFSTSECLDTSYQEQYSDSAAYPHSAAFDLSDVDGSNKHYTELIHQENNEQSTSMRMQKNSSTADADAYKDQNAVALPVSEDDEHCKEVQCIEINELTAVKSGDSDTFLPDETDNLKLLTDAVKLDGTKNSDDKDTGMRSPEQEQTQNASKSDKTFDSSLSFDLGKPFPQESLSLLRSMVASKERAVARSSSCRATFTTIPNGWFDDVDDGKTIIPDQSFKHYHGRSQHFLGSLHERKGGPISIGNSVDAPTLIENTSPEEAVNMNRKSAAEGNGLTIGVGCSPGPIPDDKAGNEDFRDENTIKDVSVDPVVTFHESPLQLSFDFGKKQQEIIELWHACNVSLIHRTYFFLLFKGDPADNIYMEVEHRRLTFLRNSLAGDVRKSPAESGACTVLAAGLKNLKRERDMLYKEMLKKLSDVEEKEALYKKWNIPLNTKQRRLQLAQLLWTDTDLEHVRDSAALVVRLVGLIQPSQALKEMFGLSFAPQSDRRSFSWIQAAYP